MTERDLTSLIRQLHGELAAGPALDDSARDELRVLAADLERLTAVGASPDAEGRGVRARLAKGVRQFEASHPELSRTLANLIDALALYGL